MKTLLKFLAILALLALTALSGRADAISGNVALGIGNDVSPQWDVTGGYNLVVNQAGGPLTMNWIMVMDPSGKYTGTATLSGNLVQGNATNQVNVNFDFAGKVSKQGGVVTVPLKWRGKGVFLNSGVGSFVTGSVMVTLGGTLVINKDTLAMEGPLAGSFTTRPAGGGVSVTTALNLGNVSVNLQSGMNGSWQLLLENMALDAHKRYSGDAQVVLSDGRTFDFDLTGTYAPRTGISRIALKGTGAGKGMSLVGQFTYDANGLTLGIARKMTGKILTGQPLTVPATTSNIALTPASDGGSELSLSGGSLVVGNFGNGILSVENGTLSGLGNETVVLVGNETFNGTVTINGDPTLITIDGIGQFKERPIGKNGNASFTVINGETLNLGNATALTVYSTGVANISDNGTMMVPSGTALYIKDGGQLNVDGGTLNIEDGGFLVMENGGDLTITNGGSVNYANPDGVLITNAGNLTIANGTITPNN